MGRVVATVGVIVGAVALAATGIGAIAAPALAGAVSIGGISASTLLFAGAALQAVGQALIKRPKLSGSTTDRLNASLVTDTPRKMVFGRTALNTDLRYQEWWGRDQEYCSQVFVVASHWCESIDEIWLDDKLAWSAGGGVTGEFAGYLGVATHAQAVAGSTFYAGWSGRWGANAAFAGCATLYLQFKVTGNGKKGKSPFSSTITSRVTVVGNGARLPDPRFDTTLGGAGAVRLADQTTWAWASNGYEGGRNPALALLFYLIGWRIQNPMTGEWKLAVGRGVPVDRIDVGSFITAANLCDEMVMRADGGMEPRYRCDGTFSEEDDPTQVIAAFEASMNGKLRDSTGRFALQILHNDLGTPVIDFTDDDVLGDFSWTAGNNLNDRRNVARGRLTDPASLYQLVDFPAVRIASVDGIERIDSVDLALVQSPSQGQRIAKQRLQRAQYQGAFAAEFNARGWAVKDGDVVRLTFSALGFDRKLFRVAEGVIDPTGVVPLVLVEEHVDIYAWDRDERPAVEAAEPNTFNPLLLPIIVAIDEAGKTAEWPVITGEGKPEDYATNSGDPDSPFGDGTVAEALATLDKVVPLEARLDPITTDISALKDARVDADAAIGALVDRVAPAEADISALKLAEQRLTPELDALDGVVAGQAVAQRGADEAVGRIEEALLRTLLESARTRDVLRDAGIVVDPATGVVRIFAVDQLKDRTSTAEIAIDAVKSVVSTKASVNQVNELIALAVLDPSQVAELEPIIARLTQAESRIDGLNAAVTLKASIAELTALTARTRATEIDVDAMKGQIVLKANADIVDQIGLRTSQIEQTLTSLPDTAGFVVSVQQVSAVVEDTADALLRTLVAGEDAARYQVTQIAQARQELSTRMVDGFTTEALARTALSVRIDQTTATMLAESQASITRDNAMTRRIDAQGVTLGDQSAAIGDLRTASIDAAGGIVSTQMTIRQVIGAADDSDEAMLRALANGEQASQARAMQLVQIQTEFTTTLVADRAASAAASQAILARMGAAEAAIVTTSKVLADTTGAYGDRLNALEVGFANPITGLAATRVRINAVERASADADEAIGERIDTIDAVVNDAVTGLPATQAALVAGLKAAADRDAAFVDQFEQITAELYDPNTGLAATLATVVSDRRAMVEADAALTERIDAQGVVQGGQAASIGDLQTASIAAGRGIAATQMTIRQVVSADEDDAEALLRTLAAGEVSNQTRAAQMVQIQTEFSTSLVAGQLSEAIARQALLARMGLAEAAIVTTSKVLADAQRAFTTRQDALEAAFNDAVTGLVATRGRIVALAELTAEQNRVVVGRLDLMDAQLLDPVTGAPISGATIAADRKVTADAIEATLQEVEQLRADFDDPDDGLAATAAGIEREATARAAGDQANADELEIVSAQINDPTSGLAATRAAVAENKTAQVDGDKANATSIDQVTARLDGVGEVGIEQVIEAVVDRLGNIEGSVTVAIDINGNLVGYKLIGSQDGPGSFNLINTDLRMGTGLIISRAGPYEKRGGAIFGANNDLAEWFGLATIPPGQETIANSRWAQAADGQTYVGGTNIESSMNGPNRIKQVGLNGSTSSSGNATTTITTVSAGFPPNGRFRITGRITSASATNGGGGVAGTWRLAFFVNYGSGPQLIAEAPCSVDPATGAIEDGVLALSGQLFPNPGTGLGNIIVTSTRTGPPSSGISSDWTGSAIFEWVNA